ncbi:FMN-binding protein [bacterium]|nr:FMN-binding protein [bacterium]
MSFEKANKSVFPEATKFNEELVLLTDEQVQLFNKNSGLPLNSRIFRYVSVFQNEHTIGYTAIQTVPGKNHPFTIMVACSNQLEVIKVIVLDYSSPYGGEVQRSDFLHQFAGKSISDKLQIGEDIDGISGATYSSHSVADGVRGILSILSAIFE